MKGDKRFLSLDFLAWQHETQRCLACGALPIECHHVISRKWKTGSDLRALPLCYSCHHVNGPNMGWKKFEALIGDFEAHSHRLVRDWLLSQNVPIAPDLSWIEIEETVTNAGLATEYTRSRRVNRGTKASRKKKKAKFVPYRRPW